MQILSGKYKGQKLKSPKGRQTRPTLGRLRKSVFDRLQHEIEGAAFLDLFAGSGSMGIEALSRGAEKVIFVEKNRAAIHCIKENFARLNIEAPLLKLGAQFAVEKLKAMEELFDIIYLDPPYAMEIVSILKTLHPLLKPDGILFLEQGKKSKFTSVSLEKIGLHQINQKVFGDTTLYIFDKNVKKSYQ